MILLFFTTFYSLTLLLSPLPLSSSSFTFSLLFTGLLLLTRPPASTDTNAPTAAAIVLLNAFLLRLSSSRHQFSSSLYANNPLHAALWLLPVSDVFPSSFVIGLFQPEELGRPQPDLGV
jgi:hypothetical protein